MEVFQETVYVSTRKEMVYALDASNGKLKWSYQMQPTLEANILGWKYFSASPQVSNEKVFVPSGDGNLYALNTKNGKLVWKYAIGERIRATPLVDGEVLYQPANDGFVHVLDKNSGKLLWKFETNGASGDPNSRFTAVAKGNYDKPSIKDNVLVFGLPIIPDTLIGERPESGLM